MTAPEDAAASVLPLLQPMGDSALLVRFGSALSEQANRAATAFAARLGREPIAGVVEVVPNLVSVLLRYDPLSEASRSIPGEVRLRLFGGVTLDATAVRLHGPALFEF